MLPDQFVHNPYNNTLQYIIQDLAQFMVTITQTEIFESSDDENYHYIRSAQDNQDFSWKSL